MTSGSFVPDGTPRRWQRARHFRIRHVGLNVTVDLDARTVSGAVTHAVELLPHGNRERRLVLDQRDLEIRSVAVDGAPVAWSVAGDSLSLALPEKGDGPFQVKVEFTARDPRLGLRFCAAEGDRPAQAWTQGAMHDHRHWFPCFDDPNNLSTFAVRLRHRTGTTALSNGVCEGREDRGDGWTVTTWRQDRPHVLYLLNVAVGRFDSVDDASGPVPMTHHLPAGQGACSPAMFAATGFALKNLADLTARPFPWPRYGHVVVRDFAWGGMENAGLTTITDRVVIDAATRETEGEDPDALVIHEAVHQWFGDLLTMKHWRDLWLNESLATWLEARLTAAWRASRGGVEADELAQHLWQDREAYLDQESSRYSRPLVTDRYVDAYELFDRVAYEKGALVLEHLAAVLGFERLRAALRLYVERHAHDLVETADLRQAVEDATGEPMDWFFAQWLERAGHPKVTVEWSHDPVRGRLLLTLRQGEGEPWRLPLTVAWRTAEGRNEAPIDLREREQVVALPCASAPKWVCVDPAWTVPAEWEEKDAAGALLARAADRDLAAAGRARACRALAKTHPTVAGVEALAALIDAAQPRLVAAEAVAALAAWRTPAAIAALIARWPTLRCPRRRRDLAKALGACRGSAEVAARLIAWADEDPSRGVAGELLAARGKLDVPGATADLRSRLDRPSWNDRLRAGILRGLGDSLEAAAVETVLGVLVDDAAHPNARTAAASAAAKLGANLPLATVRCRLALVRTLDSTRFHLRLAVAKALGDLGDAAALPALVAAQEREIYAIITRAMREAAERLRGVAAGRDRAAALARDLEQAKDEVKKLTARLAALEAKVGEAKA